MSEKKPLVGVIMGSKSDWETMKNATDMLTLLGVSCEAKVMSAHRTPDLVNEYAGTARERGMRVIIAGAGGAAHLAGVAAGATPLPVLAVPIQTKSLGGLDSLLAMVQMPKGIPVATFAIGNAGAANAGIFAAQILAGDHPEIAAALDAFRAKQTADGVANQELEGAP
jgi:5-(carboxyamino)imidazole ribonucleotide mutase